MGCLLAIFAGMFPRIALVIFWLARPDRMDAVFTSFVWPVLGIVFLPFTTLIYVLLWQPVTGVTGWDWWWIALAIFLDVAHWGARREPAAFGPAQPDRLTRARPQARGTPPTAARQNCHTSSVDGGGLEVVVDERVVVEDGHRRAC